jgi:preprotein translocase subunit SecA
MPDGPLVPAATWRSLSVGVTPPRLPRGLDAAWAALEARIQTALPRRGRYMRRARRIHAASLDLASESESRLRERALAMHDLFRLRRDKASDLDRAYALLCEISWRKLNMRPHIVQIAAALALHRGCVAELATGEGKSLSATLPATIAGWRGRGCHVITVNDYLAQRDAAEFAPLYRFCGLTVAPVISTMPPPQRRAGYNADITYTTNKEVAADFLRDQLQLGRRNRLTSILLGRISEPEATAGTERLVMRGLACAIIDEADSILIDEAVTPLIISGDSPNTEQADAFRQAADLAGELEPDTHYRVDHRWREVRLTSAGREKLDELCEELGGVWAGQRRRDELVTQALTARELYILGKQYVVQEVEGKQRVVIVDEFTGRLMPDRTWRHGLHQAVEAKEGLEVQPPKQTLARVSFQRFFRLYKHLCGMTGTAWESRFELWQIYRLPVVRIPTHRPTIRKHQKDRVYGNSDHRWEAVVDEVRLLREAGRPVLIGTRSVRNSEHLSLMLSSAGMPHVVLNAVRHAEEAQIVAAAGQPGRITVATNMAGRGTDIKLGHGVPQAGGLAVIATERHESGRIDRQLFGRAGRQGDPGGAIAILSIEDELVQRYAPWWAKSLLRLRTGRVTSSLLVRWLLSHAQRRSQNLARRQRRQVQRSDDWLDESLSFAGSGL